MGTPKGRFVWFDLMTKDAQGATAFYTETIGWKTQTWEGPMDYTMWVVGEQPVGGVMPLPKEAEGVPPHWIGYAKVDDVDAKVALVKELGGTVHRPGDDIPEVGRFAIVADPQGATFALFSSLRDDDQIDPSTPGAFSWSELNTTDYEAAWKFYSKLLGWDPTSDFEMGEMGTYKMFTHAGGGQKSMGGMSNAAKAMNMPAHWLYYVTVDDIDAAVSRVKSQGGKILNGPMDIPGEVESKIAQCMDPQGAAFALYWENR